MRTALLLGTLSAVLSLSATQLGDTPPYQHLPVFTIDLDAAPSERFVEVTTALKPQIIKMADDYLHLVPGFVRSFFESNQDVIRLRHKENSEEIDSISQIIGFDSYVMLMLNYAFELGDALCTSIIARQTDGTLIHGRNMDFAFPDAMRNASYIGQFYRGGELLYEAVMFGGYVGVASASRPGIFTLTLNARNVKKSIEEYFNIMGRIYTGLPEVGIATRDAIESSDTFESMRDAWSATGTAVPMYLILAGTSGN